METEGSKDHFLRDRPTRSSKGLESGATQNSVPKCLKVSSLPQNKIISLNCSSPLLCSNYNNNSNTEGITSRESSPHEDPPRKKLRATATTSHRGNIKVTLEGKSLWDEFCRRGTEMIVNRAGRRMFPGFSVIISALKPKAKYSMKLEVVLADNHRFKFLNSRWLAVGSAEPQPLSESYLHPDSPNSGAFWMRHGISFRKLKITNNKEQPGSNALLYSMHKYFLRLVVEEERKSLPGGENCLPKIVFQADFPETTFVAVTAYQNEEVTQLKITNNPFAKAFRENATDMDWEATQMFYTNQGAYSPSPQHSVQNAWSFPTTPLTAVAQLSPLPSFAPSSIGYYPPLSQFPYATGIPTPNYFQWPPNSTSQCHDPVPSNHGLIEGASLHVGANLPDFDTVFTLP